MASKYTDSYYFQAPNTVLVNAVHATLIETCRKTPSWTPDGNRAILTTGYNFWSYGEVINVYVQPSGEVIVNSECSFPLQLFDWGVNKRNCTRILAGVANRLAASGYSGVVPR